MPRRRPPSAVETIGPSGLPWRIRPPFAIHVFTGLPYGSRGTEALASMTRRGAILSPVGERGGSMRGMGEQDTRYGDDRYVFFTLGAPLYGDPGFNGDDSSRPAVAFSLDKLARFGKLAWRPHDLVNTYTEIEIFEKPTRAYRRRVARVSTIWNQRLIRALSALSVEALRACGDAAVEASVRAEAAALLAPFQEKTSELPAFDWLEAFRNEEHFAWPEVLGHTPRAELLLAGSAPISQADWHFDAGERVWREGLA